MTNIIPPSTKQYLVSNLETKVNKFPQDFVFENKKLYQEAFDPEPFKKPEGGFGVGTSTEGKKRTPSTKEILMGNQDKDEEKEDWMSSNPILQKLGIDSTALKVLGAGAMGVAGGAVKKALDTLGGQIKGVGAGYTGKVVASLGKQAEEISGKTWFERQMSKIGKSSLQLAASGAGSPWTPFEIPQKKSTELQTPEDRDEELAKQRREKLATRIKDVELARKAQQLGITP